MRAFSTIAVALALLTFPASQLLGQSTGEFRSHTSGNWSDVNTWERYDGAVWINPSPAVPTGAETISIMATDSVTVDVPVSLAGTLKNAGKIGGWDILTIVNGGSYVHQRNAGTIPLCTWAAGSTCFITGVIDTAPAYTNQSFYNLVWNCPGQTTNLNLGWDNGSIVLRGTSTVLNTNWSRASTTTPVPQLRLFADSGSCTIQGDLIVSGRTSAMSAMGSHYLDTITINGNIVVSGNAVLSLSNNSGGIGLWYLKGNLSSPDTGTLAKSTQANTSKVLFSSGGTQAFSAPPTGVFTFAGAPNFEVLPGTTFVLATDKDVISGAGSFRLDSGTTVVIGNSRGLSAAIACSGTNGGGNLLSTGANYVFSGTSPQLTSTHLPSTVHALTISNSSGVTLEVVDTVTTTLNLDHGKFILGDHSLTVGAIAGGTSANYVCTDKSGALNVRSVGNSDVVFPVGTATSYLPVTINNAGAVDDFSVRVKSTFDYPPTSNAVLNAQWTISEKGTGGNATVTLQWNTSDERAEFLRGIPLSVARYTGTNWSETAAAFLDFGDGTYTARAGGFATFSPFTVCDQGYLPVQIASFTASLLGSDGVRLDWRTASEVNTYGFVVERSLSSGTGYEDVSGLIPGHGTTLLPQRYTYTDASRLDAERYYRLRQIDLDNSVHFTEAIRVVGITGIAEPEVHSFGLSQNYPNPFNPRTVISGQWPVTSVVKISVCDVLGREVAILANGRYSAGKYSFTFDGRNLTSGIYFCRLSAGAFTAVRSMCLLK